MRSKLIGLFLVTFCLFMAIVIWRVDSLFYGDKIAWGEAQSRTQMSAINKSLETEMKRLTDVFLLAFPQVSQLGQDYGSEFPFSKFQMLAQIRPSASGWKVESKYFLANADAKKWAVPYSELTLKNVKPETVSLGSQAVFAILDPKSKPHLLLVVHTQTASLQGAGDKQEVWYAGVLKSDVFQNILDRQKGQVSSVYVVNALGQAISHTEPEYVGKLLTEDPIVKELMAKETASGSGFFNNLGNARVQGFYEQVNQSNMYVVVSTPVAVLAAQQGTLRWQLIFIGLGLAFLAVGAFVVIYRAEKELVPVGAATSLPKTVSTTPPPPATVLQAVAPQAHQANSEDRMRAFKTVASSLSHELWGPLTAILAKTKVLRGDLSNEMDVNALDRIDMEARGARELVQKLLVFCGEETPSDRVAGLDALLNGAIKKVEGKVINKGIQIEKNISIPGLRAGEGISRAVEAILLNAVEAMERAATKKLAVSAKSDGHTVTIKIKDSGEGIEPQNLQRVFDPFFTTRGHQQHVGLGLSLAAGLVKECHGEIQMTSERGQGTEVTITFPEKQHATDALTTAVPDFAEEVVPPPPPMAKAKIELPKAEMPQLLVDNTVEKMIDDADEIDSSVDLQLRKVENTELELPPPPPAESIATAEQAQDYNSKIDKPKLNIKKRESTLTGIEVDVRRPGAQRDS